MSFDPQYQGFARFLERPPVGSRRRPVRPRTVEEYVRAVQRAARHGDLLREEHRPDVSPGYRQLARAAAIAWGEYQGSGVLQAVRGRLRGLRWERTAARRPRVPVDDDLKPAFERELRRLEDPCRALVELLWDAGMRLGDALSIHRASVIEAQTSGVLQTEGKGGRILQYPWRGLRRPLERLLRHPWDVAWQACGRSRLSAEKRIRRLVHAVARRSGVERPGRPVFPHLLRHTAALDMLRATNDLHLTSRFLGHSSVAVTESYLRGRPVEDLGRGFDALRELRARP